MTNGGGRVEHIPRWIHSIGIRTRSLAIWIWSNPGMSAKAFTLNPG